MGAVLLVALLAFPFAEIALLIVVGRAIGVAATLALLVLAVLAGLALIRLHGFATLLRLRAALARGEPPGQVLFEGACVAGAGVLLIVPGFLSDGLALALLTFLPLRRLLLTWMWRSATARRAGEGTVIEGEYETVEDNRPEPAGPPKAPSPWLRGTDDDGCDKAGR